MARCFLALEKGHGDLTCLVCLDALNEAYRDLESARLEYSKASMALATSREKLDQVVESAFRQQSFRPIEALFCEEEAALADYEKAVAKLAQAEGRWWAMRAALAYEQEMMRRDATGYRRLN